MRVLVVAGARPNFMKVAPILRALTDRGHEGILLHTGQHYDAQMSDAFFDDLELPAPNFHLGVGSGSHARQTARIMERFEPVLLDVRPDWVTVVGDVNSTLACALVAAKLKEETGCRTAHVEAGLRSHDWRMPEEVNRVLTDRLSDLLLTPSLDAIHNLVSEGISEDRIVFVGNVMIDTLMHQRKRVRGSNLLEVLGLKTGSYSVVTLHRPSNVDTPAVLGTILRALRTLAEEAPVAIPLHPRTRENIRRFGFEDLLQPLRVVPPLSYHDMLALVDGAAVVLTDSGGLQEETTALGIPCITLREQTERPVTITEGTNRLVPWPVEAESLLRLATAALREGRRPPDSVGPRGWDGRASERVVRAMEERRGFDA